MSDRIVVLNEGKLQQLGTPEEIYNQPANAFIAGFVGSPPMNFFDGQLQNGGDQWLVKGEGYACEFTPGQTQRLIENASAEVQLGVRPEDIEVLPSESPTAHATVVVQEPLGSDLFLTLELKGVTFKARTHPDARIDRGDSVPIRFKPTKVHLFNRTTGVTLLESKQ